MEKQEVKEKILDRIKFGDDVMRSTLEEITPDFNYRLRIMTIFTDYESDKEYPLFDVRYELDGDKLTVWVQDVLQDDDEKGITLCPEGDYEERLEFVTGMITDIFNGLEDNKVDYRVSWLGD